ncbi:response regulator [Pseudobacteroides cellulosolvens]|uniref:Stage 0 sporulation protein A homolog n=1 Tax=Pseudobacteroides cellulosolvens ATCC 35603 = DSM 2933 TaxID=398512 RepID=A0A0L6JUR6_9FIRM|nr:response regulator transcription factor [Pseudobacteroides cellulosolvens]KNY29568.1 two component transcriptional regulator, LuxR family [Pseudobacteroides cellulosolvens ATCC 35603 = DSM 2933]
MIKLLILESQRLIGEGFKSIVESNCSGEIEVVELATDCSKAFELCKKHSPDILLMDLQAQIQDAIEAIRLVKSFFNNIKVVILTTFYDYNSVYQALKHGADGYLLKDIATDNLVSAIRNTMLGLTIIDDKVYRFIMDNSYITHRNERFQLTEREKTVLELVANGKSNKLIASDLCITEGRVKNIITSILRKLNLSDRTSLAVFAMKNDLLKQIV